MQRQFQPRRTPLLNSTFVPFPFTFILWMSPPPSSPTPSQLQIPAHSTPSTPPRTSAAALNSHVTRSVARAHNLALVPAGEFARKSPSSRRITRRR